MTIFSSHQNEQKIEGFGTLYHVVSALSPLGCFYVRCGKHPKRTMGLELTGLENGFERGDKIHQAFKACPDCMDIEASQRTRFPEGAEL